MLETAYFAERDENNELCALWVRAKHGRGVRVFDPATEDLKPLGRVSISGATETEVEQWFAVQRALLVR